MVYSINFTQEQLTYIGNVLGRCPFSEVKDIVASLQAQITKIEDASKSEVATADKRKR